MQICIFGASSATIDDVYLTQTQALSEALARRGHSLIFGGGANGLMGAAARGFTAGGGRITGVAPRFFDQPGILYQQCDEFVYPDSMRDRKKYMEDNADAFIVAPGGIGTYEELFEVLTLKQLARHNKPIVLFNINGFFDKLLRLLEDDERTGFIRAQTLSLLTVANTAEDAIYHAENDRTPLESIRFYDAAGKEAQN